MIKGRPPRLDRLFPDPPLFFVTFSTRDRRQINRLSSVQAAFERYAARASAEFGVAVGRYVIMPDHIHLFVQGGPEFILSPWVGGLKRVLAIEAGMPRLLWQPGFFDHVLRSEESYLQKWEYVRDNPVRARLVERFDDWPYQGEVVIIDRF
jgi:REP element-mobilizing transposase RayT